MQVCISLNRWRIMDVFKKKIVTLRPTEYNLLESLSLVRAKIGQLHRLL